ncbi:MAG: hypothetical protein QOH71_890 [Blastocatellia bacterium]|jgi:hypothetical protein|nr:hypothetical protein [Blastocatellia bacterium]
MDERREMRSVPGAVATGFSTKARFAQSDCPVATGPGTDLVADHIAQLDEQLDKFARSNLITADMD